MITGSCCGSPSSGTSPRRVPARRGIHQRSAARSSSGVASIEIATTATSSELVGPSITRACVAVWKTTKPNSPPWREQQDEHRPLGPRQRHRRAIAPAPPPSAAGSLTTSAAISSGARSTTAKSMLMPTAMKNSPSSSP
jgi:hypothetical protein